jgi:hypothetical protein
MHLTMRKLMVPIVAIVLAGCAETTSAPSHQSSSTSTTTTTVAASPVPGGTVLPVGTCQSTNAAGGLGPAWVPTTLTGSVPPALESQLEYYSVGTETVLGPRGWSCSQLFSADGSSGMSVYQTGQPNPTVGAVKIPPGTPIISATFDYTAHVPGIDLVCPYFPAVATKAQETCPSGVPSGEKVQQVTADVVTITDPPHVMGSLAGSGGAQQASGLMIVPQASNVTNVSVAEESCSLPSPAQCAAVLDDFLVRQFPVPTYPNNG